MFERSYAVTNFSVCVLVGGGGVLAPGKGWKHKEDEEKKKTSSLKNIILSLINLRTKIQEY